MTTNDSPSEPPVSPKKPAQIKQLGHQVQKLVVKRFRDTAMPRFQRFSRLLSEQYRKIDLKKKPRQRRFVVATATFFIVWLLLVGNLSLSEILVGFMVALLTTWLSSNRLTFIDNIKFSWAAPWHILRYLQVFLVELIRANIDIAHRVLLPRLPINPALVEVQTQLKSPLGKLVLANSITLTPGTLTVDVVGDRLQVHWVDSTPGVDLEHATRAIVLLFERHLQEFLE